jgi:UPF0042 nucleotide-binding protein
MNNLSLAVITGLSGGGKSTAVKALEDMGYYTVDNMPLLIIEKFVELFFDLGVAATKIAMVIDIRSGDGENTYKVIEFLKNKYQAKIVFLATSKEVLLKRYNTSRRKHPLGGALEEAIEREILLVNDIKDLADIVIDTSHMNVHELANQVIDFFMEHNNKDMLITLNSFGFKYGLPMDSDLVFDVRFLKNPFFVDTMRDKTGMDDDVYEYVMSDPAAENFLAKLSDMLFFLIPQYQREGKWFLKISIGCTGGKHRSVSVLRYLEDRMKNNFSDFTTIKVRTKHRDIELR